MGSWGLFPRTRLQEQGLKPTVSKCKILRFFIFYFLVISFDLVLRAKGSKEIFIQEESFGSRSMDDCSS